MATLVVTNGDSGRMAVYRALGEGVDVLAWNDVLHDGPVTKLDLDESRAERAEFLQSAFRSEAEEGHVLADLQQRDKRLITFLASAKPEDELVLWFESDLYDQLQVAQVVSAAGSKVVNLVTVPWTGTLNAGDNRLPTAFASRGRVSPAEVSYARQMWTAFISSSPEDINDFLARSPPPGPFSSNLRGATERLVEEYPSVADGLSRTQRQVLICLHSDGRDFGSLFRENQRLEEDPFMGDWSFARVVESLASSPKPAVFQRDSSSGDPTWEITPFGRDLVNGQADFLAENIVDRWLGGVRLNEANGWRQDHGRLVRGSNQ